MPKPGVVGVLHLVSYPTFVVTRVRGSGMWSMAGVVRRGTRHGTCAGTGRQTFPNRGSSYLGFDRRGRRSSNGDECDIVAQGLVGLIEYSYWKLISKELV
jgi:hypothetical protein